MNIDFSALDDPDIETGPNGRPLTLKVADIDEDENQPRQEFDLTEMIASIKARLAMGKGPIKQPISVKPHPTKPNRWLLNDGARRFRSHKELGLEEILAWVDEDHDDYDQVVVNQQHDKLKAMELALFIKKKLGEGDSKSTIANRLGVDNGVITHHLALVDAPDCVTNAYRAGKTKSARTLYELRNAHERFPEQVDAWVDSVSEVTRPQITAFVKSLEAPPLPKAQDANSLGVDSVEVGDGQPATKAIGHQDAAGSGVLDVSDGQPAAGNAGTSENTDAAQAGPQFGHDQKNPGVSQESPGSAGSAPTAGSTAAGTVHVSGDDGQHAGAVLAAKGGDAGNRSASRTASAGSDPARMAKPLLLVEFDGRSAAVLLHRRPTTPGLIHIRFEDGGGEQEVEAGLCKINQLTEG